MLHDILKCDLVTDLDRITDFDNITKFNEVSIDHLYRVWLANRGRLLLRTLSPVQILTFIVLMLRIFSPEFMLPDFEFQTSLGTFILPYRF